MDNDVLEQVFRLLHQFRVEADVSGLMVAAAPLGLHPLQEVFADAYLQDQLPFLDQCGNDSMQERLVPFVNDLGALGGIAAGANGDRDALVVERDDWLRVAEGDREQVPTAPKVVALPLNESARRLPGLAPELRLLASDPTESGNGIGAGHFQTGRSWGSQSDASIGRVNREMDILDVLSGHLNRKLSELDGLGSQ